MADRERFAQAAEAAFAAVDAATVALYLPEADGRMLRRVAGRERSSGAVPLPAEVAWGKGLIGAAVERAEPAADDVQGELAAPALLGDEAVGALVAVRAAGRGFAPAEVDDLMARARALARELAPAPSDALWSALARCVPAPGLAW